MSDNLWVRDEADTKAAIDAIAETGEASRDFNRREFVAKALAREDGKRWGRLPNVSTLWFKDKMHYRVMADRAMSSLRLWDMYRFAEGIRAPSTPDTLEDHPTPSKEP